MFDKFCDCQRTQQFLNLYSIDSHARRESFYFQLCSNSHMQYSFLAERMVERNSNKPQNGSIETRRSENIPINHRWIVKYS